MENRSGVGLKIAWMTLAAAWVLAMAGVSWALDGKSVARLKKAGVSDQTLELMARERTVETAAFTVD